MIFIPNPNFGDELTEQDEGKGALEAGAQKVKAAADAFAGSVGAPWMPRVGEVFTIEISDEEIALVNTDYAGHLQEFGSVNNPPHAPLRRAVKAAGLRLDEE